MTTYFSDFYPLDSADGAKGSAAFLGAISTAIVYLYKRSATALTITDKPNGSVIYTFATGNTNITAVTNGWSVTIPSGTDPLYVVAATATGIDPTDTIASTEWSSPVVLAQNGLAGTNSATVFLFQRGTTSTPPAVPSTTTTYTFATGVLSGTLGSWTQSAPDSSLGKYLFVTTATAISTETTDTILTSEWSTVRILAENGADGFTAYLTNESHILPAASDGTVSSYTGATGSFIIYRTGAGDISSSFTLSTVSGANPQALTIGYVGNVYTVTGGLDAGESLATVTIRATGSGSYSGIVIDKVFTLAKSLSGANGANAKLLNIISDRQVINYTGAGALNPAPQITTFTAYKQNTTATVSWTISDTLGNVLTPATYLSSITGDSTTMTAAQFTSAISINGANGVKVTATLTDGTTLSDVITIVKVIDGVNGTNGTNSAVVYLYQRAATSPAAPTGTFTYTFSTGALSGGTPGSWTQTIPATNGNPLWVIAATASSSTATDTIAAAEFSTPVTLVQDGTNGTNGLNSASVFLYKRATSTPAVPTTTLTYTFSTGILSGTLDSWTQSIPSGTDPVYVITATAVSTGTTDTILTSEWSTPVILAQNGTNGTNGTSAVSGYITRDTGLVFTFADGTPTGYSGLNGFLKLFNGTTDVTSSATGLTATASGCTGTINTADNTPVNGQIKGYYQVTAMSADTATLVLSGTYGGVTITKTYYLSKVKAGYEIFSVLPTTNLFQGRTVYLTSDNKIYRYNGSAWVASVSATDISGTITETQIATDAITAPKIKAGEITSGKLYAGSVEANLIQANNLAAGSITAAKVGTNEIIAVTGNIKDGVITNAKIGNLEVSSAKIANLTVGTEKITGQAVNKVSLTQSTYGVVVNQNTTGVVSQVTFVKNYSDSILKLEASLKFSSTTGAKDLRGSILIRSGSGSYYSVGTYWGGSSAYFNYNYQTIWPLLVNGAGGDSLYIPLSFITYFQSVPAGTETWYLEFRCSSGADQVTIEAGSSFAVREEKR